MALYSPSSSIVFRRFFAPVSDAYLGSDKTYDCKELTDLDFLEMGVGRCLSDSRTGRDFIQRHGDHGRKQIKVGLFFKNLGSERRLANLQSVQRRTKPGLDTDLPDAFAAIPDLDGFAIYAGDGHYHKAAVHDKKETSSDGSERNAATGHFFLLNLRNHVLSHLGTALKGDGRKREHDMHAMKRSSMEELRNGEPKGRKVIVAWDKAGIDFAFWHKAKQTSGLYFISREKENMKLTRCGRRPVDRADIRNEGVTSDENVGPGGSGGAMFRRIGYTDPESGDRYVFLTTEMTLEPGLLVLIYKHRWDIEKVFDELKNKLAEKKSWASSATAKTIHAELLCMTHNLLVGLENLVEAGEAVANRNEEKRKATRRTETAKKGSNYICTALRRSTVRSLKFIRWLRNFVYRDVPWEHAIARLRHVYENF